MWILSTILLACLLGCLSAKSVTNAFRPSDDSQIQPGGVTLFQVALVALGGVIGSLMRWQIMENFSSDSISVFLVNQLGVLAAGLVAYRFTVTESQRIFWINGFAGGFSTLSSFAYILNESHVWQGALHLLASLLTSAAILILVRKSVRS